MKKLQKKKDQMFLATVCVTSPMVVKLKKLLANKRKGEKQYLYQQIFMAGLDKLISDNEKTIHHI